MQAATCGDNYTNTASGETCDKGTADTSMCNGTSAGMMLRCKLAVCGENYRNTAAGEGCDQGATDTATCNGSTAGAAKV